MSEEIPPRVKVAQEVVRMMVQVLDVHPDYDEDGWKHGKNHLRPAMVEAYEEALAVLRRYLAEVKS